MPIVLTGTAVETSFDIKQEEITVFIRVREMGQNLHCELDLQSSGVSASAAIEIHKNSRHNQAINARTATDGVEANWQIEAEYNGHQPVCVGGRLEIRRLDPLRQILSTNPYMWVSK